MTENNPSEIENGQIDISPFLLPLRKFKFTDQKFKSYAPPAESSGSAVKEVEAIKNLIPKRPNASTIRKSKLQRFLEENKSFNIEIIINFLTPSEIFKLSLTNFFLYQKILNISEYEFQISISSLCKLVSVNCAGIIENNYIIVNNIGLQGNPLCTEPQLRNLMRYFSKAKTDENFYLKEFYIEPEPKIEERILFDFFKTFGSSISCECLTHLSLEGARLQEDGFKLFCDSIQVSNSFPNLLCLNVSRNILGYTGLHRLKLLLEKNFLPSLTTLNTSENSAGNAIFEFIEIKFSKLKSKVNRYDFSSNNFSPMDPDAVFIITNTHFSTEHIVSLDLSFNPIEDLGMCKFFSNIWPHQKLFNLNIEELNLHNCSIGDESLHYILEMISSNKMNN